jgi:hypothetical protein
MGHISTSKNYRLTKMPHFSLSRAVNWSAAFALRGPWWVPRLVRLVPLWLLCRLVEFLLARTNHDLH